MKRDVMKKFVWIVICTLFLLSTGITPAAAQDVKGVSAYDEVIDLQSDGTAKVTINFTLSNWESDSIDLPLNFSKAENIVAEAQNVKITAKAGKANDMKVLNLKFDAKPPATLKVKVTFDAKEFFDWSKKNARGYWSLAYTYTNTGSITINKYTLKILLPAGHTMTGVTSSTPKATGEEVEPPYKFTNQDGRVLVSLNGKNIGPGKTAAIAFNFQPQGVNALPIILVALILCGAALYFKKDVLTGAGGPHESAG